MNVLLQMEDLSVSKSVCKCSVVCCNTTLACTYELDDRARKKIIQVTYFMDVHIYILANVTFDFVLFLWNFRTV